MRIDRLPSAPRRALPGARIALLAAVLAHGAIELVALQRLRCARWIQRARSPSARLPRTR